jgi:hypothetical protein
MVVGLGVLAALWGVAAAAGPEGVVDMDALEADGPLLDEVVETPSRSVHLVYTGARGGIGSGYFVPDLLNQVRAASSASGGAVSRVTAVHGVLAQEPWLLRAPDHRVAPVVAFLEGGDVRCGPPEEVAGLDTGSDVMVLDWGEPPAALSELTQRVGPAVPYHRRSCTNAAGEHAVLMGPAGARGEPSWSLDEFEFRRAVDGLLAEGEVEHPFLVVARPIQEAARTFARIERRLGERPGSLYVDAGAFVDGASSVRDGDLSMHRPLGFDMLERLGPTALAPGRTELAKGARHLFSELDGKDLPYIATNWVHEDASLELEEFVLRDVETPGGPVRLAFVAIMDPDLLVSIPALAADGVVITDPVDGVQPTVDRLFSMDPPPDAVIALTTAGPEVMADVRRRLRGVDVLLGDPSFATIRVVERDVALDHLPPDVKAAPVTLSLDGLAIADLRFEGPEDELDRVVNTPWLVLGEPPVDARVVAQVTATRAASYPPLDQPLVAAPSEDPTGLMAPSIWTALVCEAVRAETGADSVLLHDLPPPPRAPGELSELLVTDQLALLDVLEVHRVPGDRLNGVLDRAFGTVDVACGAAPGGGRSAWGRGIEPDRVYRLVTTDRTRRSTPLGGILESSRVSRPLDGRATETLVGDEGAPLTLRTAVLEQLRAVRDDQGLDRVVPALVSDAPKARPPQWIGRIRQASLQVERFRGIEPDDEGLTAFSSVPETLANSPSSFTLGSTGDVALEYSDLRVAGDLRFRSSYTRIQAEAREDVDGDGVLDVVEAETETADDWLMSTTWTAAGVVLPRTGKVQATPYTELRYDSEYTPIDNPLYNADDPDDPANAGLDPLLPRQADLSLALGLAARPLGPMRAMRIGGFANRALNQLEDKPTEFGGRLEVEALQALGPALRWSLMGDLQVFANTEQDDETDLRFRAFGETRLALPLARYLDVALFAQGFALQRRFDSDPAAELPVGATWNLGAAVQSTGAFLLGRRSGEPRR